jgi:FAD:protein FMN transferase
MFFTKPTPPSSGSISLDGATVRRRNYLMGTFVDIEVTGADRAHATEAIETAFSEMKRIENVFSKFLPESEVSKINRSAAVKPVHVSREVFELTRASLECSRLTRGAFDITINPLMEAWNAAQQNGVNPSGEVIESVLENVGAAHVKVDADESAVFFDAPGVEVDFGAIGKGYAIDRAIQVLRARGIVDAYMNAGGNVFCLGEEPSNIGIRNPLDPDDLIASVCIQDSAVATSAGYERFFTVGNATYGHLIDPRTGYPARNDLLSVSIISRSAQLADVFSTAVFISGRVAGLKLIEDTPDVEGVIVARGGAEPRIESSSGFFEASPVSFKGSTDMSCSELRGAILDGPRVVQ